MLAELLQVARNLTAQNIEIPLAHEDFGKPGLSSHATFKAVLDINGKIVRIGTIAEQEVDGLWTLKKGKKKFFPCVRISDPLVKLDEDDSRWTTVMSGSQNDVQELLRCIRDKLRPVDFSNLCDEYMQRMSLWKLPASAGLIDRIHEFSCAFVRFAMKPEGIAQTIVSAVEAKLGHPVADEDMRSLLALLVGVRKESKKKGASVEYKVQICFDFAPEGDVAFTLFHPKVSRVILHCLNAEDTQKNGTCALGTGSGSLLPGSFPEWSVPPVISMPLAPFSKFSEANCNYRYGRADQDAFPVNASTARSLVGALRQLTSDQLKGRTWRPLRNGKLEKKNERVVEGKDILIAYPSFSASELSIVNLMSGQRDEDDEDSASILKRFADAAEPVIRAFETRVSGSDIVDYLTVLLVRQISPGQIQLAYSAIQTTHEFGLAIRAWELSGKNLPPDLHIPLPSTTATSGFRWLKPNVLFPEEVSRALSHQWVRDGTESTRVEGPPIGMVLDLFLRKPGLWQESAERLLELTLARTETLLVGAGRVLHREIHDKAEPWKLWKQFIAKAQSGKVKRYPDYALAQTISLMGSLLYAMNSTAQKYMNESAFLVGKLLAMMDELHRCYCMVVRDGDIPNALIGNGLLGRAADSPASALDDLLDRSRIYIGWARAAARTEKMTEQKRIAVNSARKVLRLAQPLVERLHADSALENELSPISKAHLFLGYLSPVLGKDENGESTTGDDVTVPDVADKN